MISCTEFSSPAKNAVINYYTPMLSDPLNLKIAIVNQREGMVLA